MVRAKRFFFIFLFSLVFSSRSAEANFVGNDTQNFNPVPSGLDFITVHGTQVLNPGFLNTGAFLNYARNSLPPTINTAGNKIYADSGVTFADVSAAYGVSQRFEIATSLSYLVSQHVSQNQPGAQFGETGLNEIRLLAKYSILDRVPIGLAAIASVNINQSRDNPFAGRESGPTANFELATDRYLGPFLVAGNIGYRARSAGSEIPAAVYAPLGNQIIASMATSYYATSLDLKLIGEIYAAKLIQSTRQFDAEKIASEVLLGAKFDAINQISIQAGVGRRLTEGLFTPDWRVYAGLNIAFDILDRVAPLAPAPVEVVQQPVPAATIQRVEIYKGYQPGDIEEMAAKPFDDLAKNHEFQLRTSVPAADFTGDRPPFEVIRLENFDFDTGSAVIREEHYALLDRLFAYITTGPSILKLRIEGHTDSVGSYAKNKKLSQARADSVYKYLAEKGKLEMGVEPRGYGAERPIADNSNFQGRKQNRRVEIRILRRLVPNPDKMITPAQ